VQITFHHFITRHIRKLQGTLQSMAVRHPFHL
jgi:hypothetical protein